MGSSPENYQESAFEDIGYKREHHPESAAAIRKSFGRAKSPEVDRSVPKSEAGKYLVEKIEPGMYMPNWGPVLGRRLRGSEPAYDDIVNHPSSVPRPVRGFLAAQEYARRINANNAQEIEEWLLHSRSYKWARRPKRQT